MPTRRLFEQSAGVRAILSVGLAGAILATAAAADGAAAAVRKPRSQAHAERAPKGPLLIVVSIGAQRVSVFGDGELMARGAVSTGMRGHPTPEGIFSVIQKDRYHASNIYSGAPMPYMQRITWSGVALHAGVLPGYPASHGCIRMSYEFATMLWHVTQIGVRVIVAQNTVEPVEIAHPALFVPRQPTPPVASSRTTAMLTGGVRVAESTDAPTASDAAMPPAAASPDVGAAKPAEAPKEVETPRPAPKDAEAAKQPDAPSAVEAAKTVDPAQVIAHAKAEFAALPISTEASHKREQASVFISRKEGRLFVRQNFMQLFSVPVTIRHPEQPLGTHVFTAMEPKDGGSAMRWTVVSIPGQSISRLEGQEPVRRKSHRRADDEVKKPAHEPPSAQTAAAVLDRIDIPKDAVVRIAELVSPGFSFIVSDQPVSGETDDDTDFIVLTR